TYGIGAGQGYRISDIIKRKFPAYQHMTFGIVAYSVEDVERLTAELSPFHLNRIVYLMNLNDIVQDNVRGTRQWLPTLTNLVRRYLDPLRDKSYAYNYLRTRIKLALTRLGYGHNGYRAIEFFPEENDDAIKSSVEKINLMAD